MNRNWAFFFLSTRPPARLLSLVFLEASDECRQCRTAELAEWQWLSGRLFTPYSHFPVCRWIPAPRHSFGRMPDAALLQRSANVTAWLGSAADASDKDVLAAQSSCTQLLPVYAHEVRKIVSLCINATESRRKKSNIYQSQIVNVVTWTLPQGSLNSQGKGALWHAGGKRKVTSDASPSFSTMGALPCATVSNMWLERLWREGWGQVQVSATSFNKEAARVSNYMTPSTPTETFKMMSNYRLN